MRYGSYDRQAIIQKKRPASTVERNLKKKGQTQEPLLLSGNFLRKLGAPKTTSSAAIGSSAKNIHINGKKGRAVKSNGGSSKAPSPHY
jgi:hypothetical protein